MRIPFAINSAESQSRRNSRQRLVNAYAVPESEGSKSRPPIFGTPGITAWKEVGTGPLRGGVKFENELYVVSGDELYRVPETGDPELKGVIRTQGRVSFGVGESLVFNGGYYYDGKVRRITASNFQGAEHVEWIGGYFIYPKPGTDVFYVSNVEDPNAIDSTDWATAESAPDGLVAVIEDHNDLLMFGTATTEVWSLRGGEFPFAPTSNGKIELGCMAEWSPAKLDNTVFWLASDKTVRALRGVTPQKLSTAEMDAKIEKYSRVDDAVGMASTVAGRAAYTLTFPTEGKTWQYSVNTGLWNELESYGKGRWRADGLVEVYGKTVALDAYSNRLGLLDIEAYDEFGEILPFVMQSAPVHNGNQWIFHKGIHADFETGGDTVTDAVSGNARDAVVTLQWSDDGRIWSDEYHRSLGQRGQHSGRISWQQNMGRSKNRTYRLTITDPVYRQFLGAEGDMRAGGY